MQQSTAEAFTPPIFLLPAEVIVSIAGWLCISDLGRLESVCHHLRAILSHEVRALRLDHLEAPSKKRKTTNVEHLEICGEARSVPVTSSGLACSPYHLERPLHSSEEVPMRAASHLGAQSWPWGGVAVLFPTAISSVCGSG